MHNDTLTNNVWYCYENCYQCCIAIDIYSVVAKNFDSWRFSPGKVMIVSISIPDTLVGDLIHGVLLETAM